MKTPTRRDTMRSHLAIADALTTFANRLGLALEVLDDGRGGFVTRSTRDGLSGILLGTTERAARKALRSLTA